MVYMRFMVPATRKKIFPVLSVLACGSVFVTLMIYPIKVTTMPSWLKTPLRHATNHHKAYKDPQTPSIATDTSELFNDKMQQNNANYDPLSTFVYPWPSSLAFEMSPVPPYFYRLPQTHHPSDKHRIRQNLDVSLPDLSMESDQSILILFYNLPAWYIDETNTSCEEGLNRCPIKSCKCSRNPSDLERADAVIVDGVELNMTTPMTKRANQIWIFFALECPFFVFNVNYKSYGWRQMFNWTMTYRMDSDVPVPYDILFHRHVSKNYTAIALKKTRSALWLVSNCETPGKRDLFVKELNKYYRVDMFGKCTNRIILDPISLLSKYRFFLAFENSICFDYVTEKLFKTYAANVNIIPVVRGGADYDAMIPEGTYINSANFNSPRELGNYLSYLENNVTAYAEYLQRHDQFVNEGGRITLHSSFCDVCVKMHNLKRYDNWYSDVNKWFNERACTSPTDYH